MSQLNELPETALVPDAPITPPSTAAQNPQLATATQHMDLTPDAPVIPPSGIPKDDIKHQGLTPTSSIKPPTASTTDYESPMQQALTGVEGALQGATFGLSNKLETSLGLTTEQDIMNRAAANPLVAAGGSIAGNVGSLFIPGVGEGWLLAKAGKLLFPIAAEASALAKVGSLAMRGAIEMGGFAGGDELSDAFLGKGHDATAVASHIIGAGAIGLLTAGTFGMSGQGLEYLQNQNLGKYLDDFRIGMGKAASSLPEEVESMIGVYKDAGVKMPAGMQHGLEFSNELNTWMTEKLSELPAKSIAAAGATKIGTAVSSILGPLAGIGTGTQAYRYAYKIAKKWLDPATEKMVSKITPRLTNKLAVPILMNAIKLGDTTGLSQALNYGSKAAKGMSLLHDSVGSLLQKGEQKALHFAVDERQKEKLMTELDNAPSIEQQAQDLTNDSGVNLPQFAEGGEAIPQIPQQQGISQMYPAQHMMMTAARARVQTYLNNLKPQPPTDNCIFDKPYHDPYKEESYHKALDIAMQPLKVLEKVQKGTIQEEDIQHLRGMYPEVHDLLSQRITHALTQYQLTGEKPPFKVMQGLSMLLGVPLASAFNPQNIMAAQAVFAARSQQRAPAKKTDKDLGKDAMLHKTTSQTAEGDRSARKSK